MYGSRKSGFIRSSEKNIKKLILVNT